MASANVGTATFIGGVRVEKTETDFQAYDIVFVDGDATDPPPQVTGTKEYTNWMPGMQMTWAMQEDLLLRAAWTNTIGRPSYEQNVPFRIFELEEADPGEFEGEIEAGNSDLDPLESANYDLTLEWYTEHGGLLSAGVFFKDIDNPIFNRVQDLEDVDFEGRFYSDLSDHRSRRMPKRAKSSVSSSASSTSSSTHRAGSADLASRSATPGPTAKRTFRIATSRCRSSCSRNTSATSSVFWEKYGLELRLGYAYRSEYLAALGDEHGPGPLRRRARSARLQDEL